MRILIFTNHFYPENFKVNDIAFDLTDRGEEVTVITGLPNYPQGKIFQGYGLFKNRREIINGVRVIRLPLVPRGNGGSLRLMLNYFSYLISLLLYFPILVTHKYDTVFVHETSPVFIGIPAVLYKRIRKVPLFFWVLDLWPESVQAASNMSNKYILNALNSLVKWIYTYCDKILITSKGFQKSICEKGDFERKIEYLPNWSEQIFEKHVIVEPEENALPDGFKIMYAGNIGEAQNIETLASLANRMKSLPVKWIFLGDGRKKDWLERYIADNNLEEVIYLLGRFDVRYMPYFFEQANMMLFSLKDDEIFKLTVPARLQSFLAMGKPIVAMIEGEASEVIINSAAGVVSDCYNIESISKQLKQILENDSCLKDMSVNAQTYYNANFRRDFVLDKLYKIMKESDRN